MYVLLAEEVPILSRIEYLPDTQMVKGPVQKRINPKI